MWRAGSALPSGAVAAPLASLALASVYPTSLWREDVPYTALGVFGYAILAFALTYTGAGSGASPMSWLQKGGAVFLGLMGVALAVRFLGPGRVPGGGFLQNLRQANEEVRWQVVCDVLFVHYAAALVAVCFSWLPRASGGVVENAPRGGGPAQIVGSICAACGSRIAVDIYADVCAQCGAVFHSACGHGACPGARQRV